MNNTAKFTQAAERSSRCRVATAGLRQAVKADATSECTIPSETDASTAGRANKLLPGEAHHAYVHDRVVYPFGWRTTAERALVLSEGATLAKLTMVLDLKIHCPDCARTRAIEQAPRVRLELG